MESQHVVLHMFYGHSGGKKEERDKNRLEETGKTVRG